MQCSIIITPARTARIGLPLSLIHALDSLPGAAGAVRADFVFKMTLLLGAAGVVVEVSWLKQPTHEVHPPPPPLLPFLTLPSQVRTTASLVVTRSAAWSGEGAPPPKPVMLIHPHNLTRAPVSYARSSTRGALCESCA